MTSTNATCIGRDPKQVEEQLVRVCRKLTETEVNIEMFGRMVRSGVATNDVHNFVVKQSDMKRVSQKYDLKLSKSAMKRKLSDACALASKLRQSKNRLRSSLIEEFNYSSSKCRNIMLKVNKQNTYHRTKHKSKAMFKYKHCERKVRRVCSQSNIKDIPAAVWDILKDVKLFNQDLEPEPPADPMICDDRIKLSSDELNFLRRGPRFMMRVEADLTDFQICLEKMIAKEKCVEF